MGLDQNTFESMETNDNLNDNIDIDADISGLNTAITNLNGQLSTTTDDDGNPFPWLIKQYKKLGAIKLYKYKQNPDGIDINIIENTDIGQVAGNATNDINDLSNNADATVGDVVSPITVTSGVTVNHYVDGIGPRATGYLFNNNTIFNNTISGGIKLPTSFVTLSFSDKIGVSNVTGYNNNLNDVGDVVGTTSGNIDKKYNSFNAGISSPTFNVGDDFSFNANTSINFLTMNKGYSATTGISMTDKDFDISGTKFSGGVNTTRAPNINTQINVGATGYYQNIATNMTNKTVTNTNNGVVLSSVDDIQLGDINNYGGAVNFGIDNNSGTDYSFGVSMDGVADNIVNEGSHTWGINGSVNPGGGDLVLKGSFAHNQTDYWNNGGISTTNSGGIGMTYPFKKGTLDMGANITVPGVNTGPYDIGPNIYSAGASFVIENANKQFLNGIKINTDISNQGGSVGISVPIGD